MSNMTQRDVLLEKIKGAASNIFKVNGIDLVDISYKGERGSKILRILADKEGGITIDECAKMNQLIGEALDSEKLMEENYTLEVSSPGLDRPLKTKKDFLRLKGKRVRAHTYEPIDGKREFAGLLESVEDDNIAVSDDNAKLTKIPLNKISKATFDYKSLL